MAETYKGLTIRIGAETTSLQRALRSADSAISRTQTQLRKMSQALRMDPQSTKAINTQLDLMGNKAVETQRKVIQLRNSIQQISNQKVELYDGSSTNRSIREILNGTEDISRSAAEAADNYNTINSQIEQLYRTINKAARANENFSKAFGEKYDIRDFKDDLEGQFQNLKDFKVEGLDETIEKLREIRPLWEEAFNQNEIYKAAEALRDADTELIKTEASANQTSDAFVDMALAAERMKISPQIDRELASLRSTSDQVADSLDRAQAALKLDPGNTEAAVVAMRKLQSSASLVEEEMELIRRRMSEMESSGVQSVVRGMDNVEKNARDAATALGRATEELNDMKAQASLAEASLEKMELSGQKGTAAYEDMEASVKQCRSEVERLASAQQEAFTAAKNADMAQQYDNDRVRLAELTSQLNSYKQSQKELTSVGNVFRSNTLMELGMTMSTTVTPAIVGMGYAAVESAREIDSAYRDMRKTVNGTEDDFEALRQAAIDFSTTHVTSADQILSIQAIGGELGVAVEDLQTFAETVSNLEVATDLNAEDAATALGQLDNIMSDLNGDTMPAFSDALVRLGNNGASTESQIVEIAKRIGSMGSIVGMTTPEILAWASSIASTGQNAEAAGTAISNTMSDLETAVAAGGDALEAFAQVSGMSAQQFADTWNADPSTAMKAFIEGLVNIEANGGSADATLQGLGITAVRQKQAIEGLMQTIGGLNDNLQMSNNAWNGVSDQWGEAGDAANEAAKKAEGFSGSIQRMLNMAQVLGAEMGEALAPVIDLIADALGFLTEMFSNAPDSVKTFIAALLGISAAIGPFLLFRRAFVSTIEDIRNSAAAAKVAKAAMGALGNGVEGVSAAFGGLNKGLVGLGAAVAAVGVGLLINEFIKASEEAANFENATEGLAEATVDALNIEQLADGVEVFGESAGDSAKSVSEMTKSISDLTDKIKETNDETATQVAQLNAAQKVINECAGKTDLTAEAQGRLQWALDLVNQQLGTNITATDVATGSYTDQNGEVQNLTESINGLIDAKKREAVANAYQENLTELYKEQLDAAETLRQAEKDYQDQVRLYQSLGNGKEKSIELADQSYQGQQLRKAQEGFDGLTNSIMHFETAYGELVQGIDASSSVYDQLAGNLGAAKFSLLSADLEESGTSYEMLKEDLESLGAGTVAFTSLTTEQLSELASVYNGKADSIKDKLAELNVSTAETRSAMVDSFSQMSVELPAYIEGLGYNLDDLAGYLIMAGVSTEQLASVGSANFQLLADEAGGNIDLLISLLTNYNQTPLIDKNGNITTEYASLMDANGQMYIWNGTQLKTINGEIIADEKNLPEVLDNMEWYDKIPFASKSTDVSTNYTGDTTPGDAAGAVDDLRARGDDTITTTIETNYVTTYSTVTSGGASSFGSGGGIKKSMPSSLQSLAAAANMSSATDTGISLMSDTASQAATAASRAKAAIAPLAARASDIARNLSVTVERSSTAGAVRSMARNMTRTPPYPGSGIRETGGGAVNITIDGIGTTGRVQSIALDLLDELERVGAI